MKNNQTKYPQSIGIIIDGNRRWASERGLSVMKGHKFGYDKLKEVLRWAREFGISTVYIYAFSTENWIRKKEEVAYLMKLFLRTFGQGAGALIKEKARIRFVGQIGRFSPAIRMVIKKLEKATANFFGINFIICLSYGGRAEILEAVKKVSSEKTKEEISGLTEEQFSQFLWTAGLPDPQLVIRTSGEIRTSNFLPWQTVYSEWFFPKTYWPDFTKSEFESILEEFSKREIRRGR
ncbi:di-trans,poly-cis-decaprenylcistransferase [Patescibacteria group bacterium]|nr:di-trans,poly-cis-decaprenylcistransferase [Patescibacteria group bacterium]